MDEIIIGCLEFLIEALIVAGINLVAAYLLQWAWNLLMPALLHWPSITYTMAVAMCVALSIASSATRGIFKAITKD